MRALSSLLSSAALALAFTLGTASAQAEDPWSDSDPPAPAPRYTLGDIGLRGGAEFRSNALYVNPIALNSESSRRIGWLEHRLRLDATIDYRDKVRIATSFDLLDGVLFGDNGTFGGTPATNAGSNINAKNPNLARPCIGLRGENPLDSEAYGYTLCGTDPLRVRKAYGDVVLPIGLLRVGRQSVNVGTGVQAADGDGRPNRFGFARQGNQVDRVLFATKPLEAFKPKKERDTSENKGLFLILAYDRLVTDSVHVFGDDVQQFDVAARFLLPKHALGRDLLATAYYVHRWDTDNASKINSFGLRAQSHFGDFFVGFDGAMNVGSTREIAAAYKFITNDPVVDQLVLQGGARAVVRYDRPLFSAYLEADYASGDGDPNNRTPLTGFTFAEDANVGLLLFEHVLAFQTARVAAAGTELIRRLGAQSFPPEAIATRGAFTNGVALFPQFDLRPVNGLLLRAGVLFAWAAAPVVDPVGSLLARDGLTIEDDLVNFVGGKPGSYYGTELDGRVSYRYMDHFLFDLEGAVLFPGNALKDEDGNAVRSVLVQGRTTFFF
ncbi:hypothetical protein [Polyangium aurulentum]|uniref:hypothetical protein n=1 Tax=Polyangium aurulentum TaxID=2567896 RepID=UPI0010AE86E0|nr:hypothetical protein [Polyangium aurulentum]UQA55963.1 alginate export family protein [Polyangium aurulentum]